ncbi:MAG TPA: DUF1615 domain-containing protein [Steroidobacteraceae bacterium]|nr:DUF1615 domain-containing protein [Steroidobacteraceae bacterium]
MQPNIQFFIAAAKLTPARLQALVAPALALCIASCTTTESPRSSLDPDQARARIAQLIPAAVTNRDAWAIDIFAAFEALDIAPTTDHTCAVVAVTQQESTFHADPTVPGLPQIARKEINSRAARYHIPEMVVHLALQLKSPNGKTYNDRIDHATTERELSEIFEDFIGSVPLGRQLFSDFNPVRTGGPMQVSVAFAESHVKEKNYPYPLSESVRHEVFTRRGGLYFGIAHLFDYEAPYDEMIFRFADFNAGHYASRNAAFQNAVNVLTHSKLATDGDLLIEGDRADEPSNTERAIRKIAAKLDMSDGEIRRDLERQKDGSFTKTKLYERVFALADRDRKRPLPRAVLPKIKLQSAKITRNLTTAWFATRVNERYRQCLQRESSVER